MPSVRELADRFRVSRGTVQKAMRDLSDRDIIKLRRRRGSIVTAALPPRPARNQIALVEPLDALTRAPEWWGPQIIRAAQVALADAGYALTLLNVQYRKPETARQAMEQIDRFRESLSGVILIYFDEIARMPDYLDANDLPWLSINPINLDTQHNYVMADQLAAGRTVGRIFARLGYQRVVMLVDDLRIVTQLDKTGGLYQGFLHENGSADGIRVLHCADVDETANYELMRQYLKENPPPQGIFAVGDFQAAGAMRACQEIGLRVPEDVGVVGSTGYPLSLFRTDPPLTEVRQPVEEIGRHAALGLLEMIRGGVRRITGRRVMPKLILRQSLAVPEALRKELRLDAPVKDESASPLDFLTVQSLSMVGAVS